MMDTQTVSAPAQLSRPRPKRDGGSFWLAANLFALLGVALAMRVWRLGNLPGINGDEAWSGVQALALVHGEAIDWWTPTGNPINVFFVLPLAALHAVFAPSFGLLRSVAVASGVLALAANFWLCRRVFDMRTATVSTLLLALLPINIAYSRFAWDASQSLLATVLVLYLPLWHLRRRPQATSFPVAGMVALAAAMLVHPTNVFAAPLVVVPMAYAWRRVAWRQFQTTTLPAKTWTWGALALGASVLAYLGWAALSNSAWPARGPEEVAAFLENYLQLFSGGTVYEYISGVHAATGPLAWFAFLPIVCKLLFGIVAVFGVWGMMRRVADDADDVDICLALGWLVMLVGFFLVAGPNAIAPHLERYGICLVAPGVAVLGRGLSWWLEPARSRARAAAWALGIAAWLMPVTFYLGYFDYLERTGGSSHVAFRTAPVEPKLAVFRYVSGRATHEAPAHIVANSWWNYWPLAYLAGGDPNVRVSSDRPWQRASRPGEAESSENTWHVEFADTPAEREALGRSARGGGNAGRHVIRDAAGQPFLSIVGPAK